MGRRTVLGQKAASGQKAVIGSGTALGHQTFPRHITAVGQSWDSMEHSTASVPGQKTASGHQTVVERRTVLRHKTAFDSSPALRKIFKIPKPERLSPWKKKNAKMMHC